MQDSNADPLRTFRAERSEAFAAKDPTAALCSVASVDAAGHARVTTLVLRDIDNQQLALFVNATSPKWNSLKNHCSIMTYWPSLQVQYRFQMQTSKLPEAVVADSWQLRPDAPKRMDWFYEQMATQSSPIADRETLLDLLDKVELPDPLTASPSAQGLALHATEVERLHLGQANGVHDRTLFVYENDTWRAQTLVP